MGCCNIREMGKDSDVESILAEFETKLELFKYSSAYLDRLAHRNSRDSKMSETQFERFFESLKKIELKDQMRDFFRLFYDMRAKNYETRLVATAGILLGKGEAREKASLLFENYDDETSRKLNKDQIKNMILDIFYVSCFCIPAFVGKNFVSHMKESIDRYKYRIGMMKNGICNHLVDIIFEDLEDQEIFFEDFKNLTCKKEVQVILDVKSFRRSTKRIFSMIERAAMTADYFLRDEKEYKIKVEMLGLGKNHHQVRNSLG